MKTHDILSYEKNGYNNKLHPYPAKKDPYRPPAITVHI